MTPVYTKTEAIHDWTHYTLEPLHDSTILFHYRSSRRLQ